MSPPPDASWSPERRDQELRRIDALTFGVIVGAVAVTAAFGAGIVWDDAHSADKASQPDSSGGQAPTVTPPGSAPTQSPASKPAKTKSGGS